MEGRRKGGKKRGLGNYYTTQYIMSSVSEKTNNPNKNILNKKSRMYKNIYI